VRWRGNHLAVAVTIAVAIAVDGREQRCTLHRDELV
jgi:hypothetical protein